ncbi:MAG: SURF1 family protein [Pseudomonadota bacterium]|nr:SURF1 family protein [Pseudomonadota bacterium]
MRLRWRFKLIPLIATVLVVALGILLGNWQERRAAQKIALQAEMSTRSSMPPLVLTGGTSTVPQEFRRVTVRGEFFAGFPVFLDNRPYQGRAGYYLVMPFKIAGADQYVLVARGWLPRAMGAAGSVPVFQTPAGPATVEGRVRLGLGHVMQLGSAAPVLPNAMVQNLSITDFARSSNLPLAPFFIEQTGPQVTGDPLVRDWPAPNLGVEKHKGYAFQWYALAGMAFLFYIFTGLRRESRHDTRHDPQHGPDPDPQRE